MSKEKQVAVKMDVYSAAAVRQVLFDAQKGYTYDEVSVPSRILSLRKVVVDLDEQLSSIVE